MLRLRAQIARNYFRTLGFEDWCRFPILFGIFGIFIAGGMLLLGEGFAFVLKLPAMGELLSGGLLQLLFFVLFNFLVLSNLLVGYSYLFRGRRTEMYLTLPLPAPRVFALHALEAIVQSSWATFLLGSAVLVSYGASHRVGALFFALMPVVLACFLLLCGTLGVLGAVILGLLRRRFGRKVFAVAGAAIVLLGGVYLATQIESISFAQGQELVVLTRLTDRLHALSSSFWPCQWTSQALFAFARGFPAEGFFALGLTVSAIAATWPFLDALGRGAYLTLWQDLNAVGEPARRRTRIPRARGTLVGLVRKDLLLFARDPTQSLQLLVFLLLMTLYTISLMRIPRDALALQYWRFVSLANLTAIAFILASFSSRFVYPLIESEGVSVWAVMSMPVPRRTIVVAKLCLGLLLMLPAAVTLAVASQLTLRTELGQLVVGTLLIAVLAVALTTLALGFSAAFARFKSDRPSEVLGTIGGTANFLASTGLVTVAMAAWVALEIFGGSVAGPLLRPVPLLVAGLLLAAGFFWWSLRSLGRREY
jgi:hypothetical protein